MFQPMNFDGGGVFLTTNSMSVGLGTTAKGIAFGTTLTLSKGTWIVCSWVDLDYAGTGDKPLQNKLMNKTDSALIGKTIRGTRLYGGGLNNVGVIQCSKNTVIELQTYDYGDLAGHNALGIMQAYKLSDNI